MSIDASAFFAVPVSRRFGCASVALRDYLRRSLPCGIHKLLAAVPVRDVGFKSACRRAGWGIVLYQIHVRLDGEPSVVTALQEVGDDAGHVRIAISRKCVIDIGKKLVGIGKMTAVSHMEVFDEGLDLIVEIPAVLFAVGWCPRALVRNYRVAGIEDQSEGIRIDGRNRSQDMRRGDCPP